MAAARAQPAAAPAQPIDPPSTDAAGDTTIDPDLPPAVQPPPPPPPPEQPPTVLLIKPPVDRPAEPAVIAFQPPPPPPPSGPGWSPVYTGSYFTRYELRSGYDDLNIATTASRQRYIEGDAIYYRLRFGIGTGLIDVGNDLKVALQFTPQATGVFGGLTSNPNSPNTIVDANLGIHEGYARVMGKHTRVDAGRFEMNYGDSLVIGNLDWNEVARSFDGIRARFQADTGNAAGPWVDVFATLLDEGRPDLVRGSTVVDQTPGIGQGDIYFAGAYGALGPALMKGLDLDAYALVRAWAPSKGLHTMAGQATSPTYSRESAAEATFGVRAKQRVKWFDYRTEMGIQNGSRPGAVPAAAAMAPVPTVKKVDVMAGQIDLELGVTMLDERLRVALEGLYASGDKANTKGKNEGWDELYPTAHKWLGLGDVWSQAGQKRTNTASGVLHITGNPHKMLTLQADGHLLARPQKSAQFFNQRGLGGGEIDLGAVLLLGKGLKIRATYAIFLPNGALYHDVLPNPATARGADPVQWCELELRYDLTP